MGIPEEQLREPRSLVFGLLGGALLWALALGLSALARLLTM